MGSSYSRLNNLAIVYAPVFISFSGVVAEFLSVWPFVGGGWGGGGCSE